MKTLNTYIRESKETYENGVDSKIYNIIKSALSKMSFSKFKTWNEDDKNKFDVQKENEKYFISNLENVKALSTEEYYNSINNKEFKDLSAADKAKFDREEGDIIIVNDDGKVLYNIDLKISSNYLGAINLVSLCFFKRNGIYVCIDIKHNDFRIVSHETIRKLAADETFKIYKPTNSYKGFDVMFQTTNYPRGNNFTSEYFIGGLDIKHIKK